MTVKLETIDGRLSATLDDAIRTVVFVDFSQGPAGFQLRGSTSSRPSHLLRAVLAHQSPPPLIADATAGLGHDGFAFAAAGCEVVMIERNETVFALLTDGVRRALEDKLTATAASRIRVVHGDSMAILRDWPFERAPDVVYLDPMYPDTGGAAAVKKRSQFLRLVAGSDPPAEATSDAALLLAARQLATRRVVVKRPKGAIPCARLEPSGCIRATATRWDIYAPAPPNQS